MRENGLLFKNYSYFLVYLLLFTGFQSTLWPLKILQIPPPQFWVPVLVYWSIYRHLHECMIMTYVLTYLIAPFTAMPISLLLLINVTMAFILYLIKSHFYQPGVVYFVFSNSLTAFMFPFFHTIYSFSFEPTPISSLLFFDRLLQILLTALASYPLYQFFIWIDNKTNKKRPTETGAQLE